MPITAQYANSKNIQKEKLITLLGKPEIKVERKKEKVQPTIIPKRKKIEVQTSRWIGLTLSELKDELNDLDKYPDSTSIKQAAYSILLSNERRLRKRDKIVDIIINRISEDKAIAHLGR
jgi:hypothetical protein